MKHRKLFALGQTEAPGLPRELYGMSRRRCVIYGCDCWACEARRSGVLHETPEIERPLPRLRVIGDTAHTDFTREFVPDIAEGYTLAVLFGVHYARLRLRPPLPRRLLRGGSTLHRPHLAVET